MIEEIKILYPDAVPGIDFELFDSGDGNIAIKRWSYKDPEPTKDQIIAVKAQANGKRATALARDKRSREYPDIGDQLDSIGKCLKFLNDGGVNIGADGIALINALQAVKNKYPV